jgi:hypothetical protein
MQMSKKHFYIGRGIAPTNFTSSPSSSIPRVEETAPVLTVDQATEGDFRYFCEHPDEEQYIRQFVPGEFGAVELPPIPRGFRYATIVSVTMRVDGRPVGRFRELMAICENIDESFCDSFRNTTFFTFFLGPYSLGINAYGTHPKPGDREAMSRIIASISLISLTYIKNA